MFDDSIRRRLSRQFYTGNSPLISIWIIELCYVVETAVGMLEWEIVKK